VGTDFLAFFVLIDEKDKDVKDGVAIADLDFLDLLCL